MKTILALILLPIFSLAQSNQVGVMVGYKAGEVSTTYTAPNELIYGAALSVTDAKTAEKRANNNDINSHNFESKIIPAVFGLIGGKFDNLSIIGKLGSAYLKQRDEEQKFYFAAGVTLDYKISDLVGLRTSYDSVSSLLLGVTFHL